jgi:transcriptional regulator with XRE-family HTH domain
MSQEAFADVLGVHRTYLGGIERGEHNLTLRSVERIAERIGIDPMELLTTATHELVETRGPVAREQRVVAD